MTVMNLLYSHREFVRYADASYACMNSLEILRMNYLKGERSSIISWRISFNSFTILLGYTAQELLLGNFYDDLWLRTSEISQLHSSIPGRHMFESLLQTLQECWIFRNEITITQSLFHGVSGYKLFSFIFPTLLYIVLASSGFKVL